MTIWSCLLGRPPTTKEGVGLGSLGIGNSSPLPPSPGRSIGNHQALRQTCKVWRIDLVIPQHLPAVGGGGGIV